MIDREASDDRAGPSHGSGEDEPRPESRATRPAGSGNALSTGLQPGGIRPGGGPGATVGSLGTGGPADDGATTGDADRNNIDEEQL
jgi:hypothetical protein